MNLELATVKKCNKELSNEVESNRSKIEELTKSLEKITLENKEIQRDKEAQMNYVCRSVSSWYLYCLY